MYNFILSNGINSHGEGSVDLLGNVLRGRGHNVIDVQHDMRHSWQVRSKNARLHDTVDILAVTPDSANNVLVGHSYGGIKCMLAAEHFPYCHIYLFRPALSKKYPIPENVKGRVTVIYSPRDWTVWLGSLLVWHPFGQAGVRGLDGATNILSPFKGHSGDFHGYANTYWANRILEDLALRQAESEL